MSELAKSAVLNLADHRITIGGQDFPWYITEEGPSVETQKEETENTEALNVLHLRVLISGNVTIEGDPAHYPDYRQRYVIGVEQDHLMSDEPYSYDQGGTFPPSQHLATNYYDPREAIAAGRRYIQRVYGPEQVLSPEQTTLLRKRFEEQ